MHCCGRVCDTQAEIRGAVTLGQRSHPELKLLILNQRKLSDLEGDMGDARLRMRGRGALHPLPDFAGEGELMHG